MLYSDIYTGIGIINDNIVCLLRYRYDFNFIKVEFDRYE